MDWDVRYNGASIKSKVLSCNITKSLESFCKEVEIELIDTSIYGTIDWTRIPETPQIEVSIDDGSGWHTLGSFFIERPTYSADPTSRGMRGVWGRSKTALLGEPFARTWTKTWVAQTDVFTICEEVMTGTGIVFAREKCSPGNFTVYPLTYSVDKMLPIDILNELAELCGAVVCTSNEDDIFFQVINYSPVVADHTFTDGTIKDYSEEINFPEFKNRVLISADESSGNCDIALSADSECLKLGSSDGIALYARVSGDDGAGINNVPVTWSAERGQVTLDLYTSNTMEISRTEQVTADGYYAVKVAFPPAWVARIEKANAGYGQSTNLADGGYSLDGATIILTNALEYCDELLNVTYTVSGVAKNIMRSGATYGEDTVQAEVGGVKARLDVYIGNPCKCTGSDGPGEVGYSLYLVASPYNICPMQGLNCPCAKSIGCTTRILCAVDEYGPVTDGRRVLWQDVATGGPFLRFKYGYSNLTSVSVEEIEATIEEIHSNYIVCKTPFYFTNVEAKWRYTALSPWIDLNYAWEIDGKTFKLPYEDGMDLGQKVIVQGTILGASVMEAYGLDVGIAVVQATVQGRKEEPMVGQCKVGVGVTIGPNGDPVYDPDPYDPDDPDDPNDPSDEPFNPVVHIYCRDTSTGATEQCTAEQRCCAGKNDSAVRCRAPSECADGELSCNTADCSANPTEACIAGRFNEGRENGCSCEEMCKNEFDRMWTTQDHDNNSYKPISKIIEGQGYDPGTPAYWDQFEKLKKEAIDQCLTECDQCRNVPTLNIYGPSEVTKPGGFQYSVTGGRSPFVWGVSGTGVSINQNGFVTLGEDACGSITVTVTDACANWKQYTSRITNAGQWTFVDQGGCYYDGCLWSVSTLPSIDVFSGEYWITFQVGKVGTCQDAATPPTPSTSTGCPWSDAPPLVWDQGSGPVNALCFGTLCGYLGWWWTANFGSGVQGWYRRRWTC